MLSKFRASDTIDRHIVTQLALLHPTKPFDFYILCIVVCALVYPTKINCPNTFLCDPPCSSPSVLLPFIPYHHTKCPPSPVLPPQPPLDRCK